MRYVDLRASLLPTDKVVEEAAFDKYVYIRDAYLQNRRSEIKDGNLPKDGRDDEECKQSLATECLVGMVLEESF